ncbi:hypothetical protein [Bradyrhizobium lablabi]|uniref:hypothetical protein n=1 Tax=Bradyrhizobium lablabi TaxID=722472 RepID=UPI001BA6FBD7|nr:hypothetical protein [Bradyrhizobium lablabi]MBR0692907.1 hypothetical protein [Bradyrhizobium lablabi]
MTMQRVTSITVSTESAEPLRGIIEIDCADAAAKFEINEELALQLCSDLERFLTQVTRRSRDVRFG